MNPRYSIPALIAALLLPSMSALGQQTNATGVADPANYTAKYINPVPGQFPIMTWGITDYSSQPGWFKGIADCGINLGILLYYDVDKVKDVLQKVEGTGMKIMTVATSPAAVKELRDNPALGGYFLADEPKATAFEGLRKVRDGIYANDTTHLAMINLYPWTPTSITRAATYEDYVMESIREVGLPVLSYDNYPVKLVKGAREVASDFYKNMEFFADISKETGIPFWAYGRTIGGDGPFPVATTADLTFEVFSALAYGAQGIGYYTYTVFGEKEGEHFEAPMDSKGQRTPVWSILRSVNRQIQSLSSVFLGAEVVSVNHTGTVLPEGTTRLSTLPAPFTSLRAGNAGILFSHLRNNGKDYFVMVNHDISNSQRVRFSTAGTLKRVSGTGVARTYRNSSVKLAPGGYAIFTY